MRAGRGYGVTEVTVPSAKFYSFSIFLVLMLIFLVSAFYFPNDPRLVTYPTMALVVLMFVLDFSVRRDLAGLVVLIGGGLNAVAIYANNGQMPVLGMETASRWWKPLGEDVVLYWLTDIWWSFSVGDFLIFAAVAISITTRSHSAPEED